MQKIIFYLSVYVCALWLSVSNAAILDSNSIWQKNELYFYINPDFKTKEYTFVIDDVLFSISHINNVIGRNFLQETNDPAKSDIRITFMTEMPENISGSSLIGNDALSSTDSYTLELLIIKNENEDFIISGGRNTSTHELLHALGFLHEHQSTNARMFNVLNPFYISEDEAISYLDLSKKLKNETYESIKDRYTDNYRIITESNSNVKTIATLYDPSSIMIYDGVKSINSAFNKSELPSENDIRNKSNLSTIDAALLKTIYDKNFSTNYANKRELEIIKSKVTVNTFKQSKHSKANVTINENEINITIYLAHHLFTLFHSLPPESYYPDTEIIVNGVNVSYEEAMYFGRHFMFSLLTVGKNTIILRKKSSNDKFDFNLSLIEIDYTEAQKLIRFNETQSSFYDTTVNYFSDVIKYISYNKEISIDDNNENKYQTEQPKNKLLLQQNKKIHDIILSLKLDEIFDIKIVDDQNEAISRILNQLDYQSETKETLDLAFPKLSNYDLSSINDISALIDFISSRNTDYFWYVVDEYSKLHKTKKINKRLQLIKNIKDSVDSGKLEKLDSAINQLLDSNVNDPRDIFLSDIIKKHSIELKHLRAARILLRNEKYRKNSISDNGDLSDLQYAGMLVEIIDWHTDKCNNNIECTRKFIKNNVFIEITKLKNPDYSILTNTEAVYLQGLLSYIQKTEAWPLSIELLDYIHMAYSHQLDEYNKMLFHRDIIHPTLRSAFTLPSFSFYDERIELTHTENTEHHLEYDFQKKINFPVTSGLNNILIYKIKTNSNDAHLIYYAKLAYLFNQYQFTNIDKTKFNIINIKANEEIMGFIDQKNSFSKMLNILKEPCSPFNGPGPKVSFNYELISQSWFLNIAAFPVTKMNFDLSSKLNACNYKAKNTLEVFNIDKLASKFSMTEKLKITSQSETDSKEVKAFYRKNKVDLIDANRRCLHIEDKKIKNVKNILSLTLDIRDNMYHECYLELVKKHSELTSNNKLLSLAKIHKAIDDEDKNLFEQEIAKLSENNELDIQENEFMKIYLQSQISSDQAKMLQTFYKKIKVINDSTLEIALQANEISLEIFEWHAKECKYDNYCTKEFLKNPIKNIQNKYPKKYNESLFTSHYFLLLNILSKTDQFIMTETLEYEYALQNNLLNHYLNEIVTEKPNWLSSLRLNMSLHERDTDISDKNSEYIQKITDIGMYIPKKTTEYMYNESIFPLQNKYYEAMNDMFHNKSVSRSLAIYHYFTVFYNNSYYDKANYELNNNENIVKVLPESLMHFLNSINHFDEIFDIISNPCSMPKSKKLKLLYKQNSEIMNESWFVYVFPILKNYKNTKIKSQALKCDIKLKNTNEVHNFMLLRSVFK